MIYTEKQFKELEEKYLKMIKKDQINEKEIKILKQQNKQNAIFIF